MPVLSHTESDLLLKAQKVQRLWLVLGLRCGLFVVELGAGFWSRSLSLLAGAGHLFSDLVTLGLTLLVIGLVQRLSTDQIPGRYRQFEAWVALLNGISLGAIALLITWEAIQQLQSPQSILGLPMLFAATLSLLVNGFSIHLLHADSHHNLSVRGVFLHGVADVSSSIGVMFSALVIYFLQWFWADAVASLLVALLICLSALSLINDSLKTLSATLSQG